MLRNTLAHLGGRGFSSVAGLITTTFITAYLGPAAMGIFGIYMVLQNVAGVFDGGMAITLNRVMAVGTLGQTKDKKHLQLFRTFEVINAAIGGLFALGIIFALPWVVDQWGTEHTQNFDLPVVAIFFGIALALRFMQTLYHNALFGAHQHFAANSVISSFAIIRGISILIALWIFHSSLLMVFAIIAASNAFEVVALMAVCRARGLWRLRVLPHWHLLREHAGAMAPISGYTIMGVILSQFDRIVVGHFVTLEQFGAYSLISSYANGVAALAYAPGNVFFPTITQATHQSDVAGAKRAVKNALRMILALTFPAGIWAMFYGDEIGQVLFANPNVQSMTHGLWVPLFLSCCVNVLTLIPYKILLAENRAADILKTNLVAFIFYPLILFPALAYIGFPSGLYASVILTSATLGLYLWQMGRLGAVQMQFIRDILADSFVIGIVLAAIFALTHRFFLPSNLSVIAKIIYIGTPAAIANLAYIYWAIARPRLKARQKT